MFVCSNMEIEAQVASGVNYETDPDKIKLFVGQIPKEYEEAEIRTLLEEFGPIHEINIIKDKDKRSKGQSKRSRVKQRDVILMSKGMAAF